MWFFGGSFGGGFWGGVLAGGVRAGSKIRGHAASRLGYLLRSPGPVLSGCAQLCTRVYTSVHTWWQAAPGCPGSIYRSYYDSMEKLYSYSVGFIGFCVSGRAELTKLRVYN